MRHHLITRTVAFLLALALGGVVGGVLLAIDVSEPWSLIAAWVTFFVAGASLVRLQQRREQHR